MVKKGIKEIKKVEYLKTDRFSAKDFKEAIPKSLVPTAIFGELFGFIFLIVILLSLVFIPWGSLLGGNEDIIIRAGFPWAFLTFDMSGDGGNPLDLVNLILDLMVYFVAAYILNVAINVFMDSSFYDKFKMKKKTADLYKVEQKQNTGPPELAKKVKPIVKKIKPIIFKKDKPKVAFKKI